MELWLLVQNLKQFLILDPKERTKPLYYFERIGHTLAQDNNFLQFFLHDAENFISENKMVINKKKTKVMNFTEIKFKDGTILETIRETRLVGALISDDLSRQKNTNYICKKAKKKIWILRRMAELNIEPLTMLDIYQKEVRSMVRMVPIIDLSPGSTQPAVHTIVLGYGNKF